MAKAIEEQFRDRNFILSRFGPGLYGFVHRALLEYCCADDIVYRLNHEHTLTAAGLVEKVFGAHAEDPAWQEVLLLTAGMINERFVGPVVDNLLARARTPAARLNPVRGARLLVLALRCVSEARRISYLAPQCEAIAQTLTAQLTDIATGASSDQYSVPSQMRELSGVHPLMRELGVGFPARETFRAWYHRAPFPAENITTAREMAETIGGIVAAILAGDQYEGRRLRRQLRANPQWPARLLAVQALAEAWPDEHTRALLTDRATTDRNWSVRQAAVQALAQGWPDGHTRNWLTDRATTDGDGSVRQAAVQALAQGWPDGHTRNWLTDRATTDDDGSVRQAAVQALARHWPDERTRALLTDRATTDDRWSVRQAAVQAVAQGWPDGHTRALLTDRATTDDRWSVRQAAVQALAQGWPDERTHALLTDRATNDDDEHVRQAAAQTLTRHWPDVPR